MAWLIEKNYHIHGPNFEIISNPGETQMRFSGGNGICSFLPWHPSDLPITARQDKAYRGKLDDMTIVVNNVAVSQKFKDLVEEFEPGIHAFAPLILERKNGERFEEQYYLFSTQQDVDCLITDNDSDNFEHLWTNERGVKQILCRLSDGGRNIPISKPVIAGKHLWTAGLLGQTELFVSDSFKAALSKKCRGYLSTQDRCVEVDRPWIAEEQMGPLLPRHRAFVASGRTMVDYTLGEIWG
jgi:hypothetical protein